jgi:glycosyltransferase involved in cell wall biosynthesis
MITKPFYTGTPSGIRPAGRSDKNYHMGKVGVIEDPEHPRMRISQKIGAVVLSYNKAWMIQRFFASLGEQMARPSQVIIVDDASSDGTPQILRALFSKYPAVRLPRNRGQSYCRNIGARSIKTDYIIFLDGDIEMHPNMLDAMEKALDANPDASIAYCHYDRVGSRTDPVRAEPWSPERLLQVNYVSMISMIRRKDMPVPPMDEALKRYEDWDLWLRMMKNGKKGVMIDQVLFTAHYQKTDLSGMGESVDWRRIVEDKHGIPHLV